ncbi:MAG TPA: 2TM domain-containing protein [Actinomycetota bacterium]|nr:2TM domain-containing protein [Actinomycetota bacterium]
MIADDEGRAQAVRRLWAKRGFTIHLTAFAIASLAMLLIWATASAGAYFWPIWPITGWGTGLAVHASFTFGQWSLSEAAIQREMRRGQERVQHSLSPSPTERG